jgi:hypothetical protein
MKSGVDTLDGEVAPGRKICGEIAFDVPESEYVTGQANWKIE